MSVIPHRVTKNLSPLIAMGFRAIRDERMSGSWYHPDFVAASRQRPHCLRPHRRRLRRLSRHHSPVVFSLGLKDTRTRRITGASWKTRPGEAYSPVGSATPTASARGRSCSDALNAMRCIARRKSCRQRPRTCHDDHPITVFGLRGSRASSTGPGHRFAPATGSLGPGALITAPCHDL